VFSRASIKELLSRFVLVQLYTDALPAKYRNRPASSAEDNKKFQIETLGTAQLPLYVILEPLGDGKYREIDRYAEGKINDVGGFAEFLKRNLPPGGEGVQVSMK
jgi:hypothetical protein